MNIQFNDKITNIYIQSNGSYMDLSIYTGQAQQKECEIQMHQSDLIAIIAEGFKTVGIKNIVAALDKETKMAMFMAIAENLDIKDDENPECVISDIYYSQEQDKTYCRWEEKK